MNENVKEFKKLLKEIEVWFKKGDIDIRENIDGSKRTGSFKLDDYIEAIDFNIAESDFNEDAFDNETFKVVADRLVVNLAKKMFAAKYGRFTHLRKIGKI